MRWNHLHLYFFTYLHFTSFNNAILFSIWGCWYISFDQALFLLVPFEELMTGVELPQHMSLHQLCSYNVKTYVETIFVLESLERTYGPTPRQDLELNISYSPRLFHLLWRWYIIILCLGSIFTSLIWCFKHHVFLLVVWGSTTFPYIRGVQKL